MFRGACEIASTSSIPPASSNTLSYMDEGPMGCLTLSSIDCLVLEAVGINGFFVLGCFFGLNVMFFTVILVLYQGKIKFVVTFL